MIGPDPTFEAPKNPELLSLGLIVGGPRPGNELLREAFMVLMRRVHDSCGRYPNEGLRINIVFQIPGPFLAPEFEGVFPARYARKTTHLLVNAAVPAELELAHVRRFFVGALSEVKVETLKYLQRRNIRVDTAQVMTLIDDLIAEREPAF